jgi:hypothetical protein
VIEYPFKEARMVRFAKVVPECPTVSFYVWAYPKIFKGAYPEAWSSIPRKWESLFTTILNEVQSACSDEQLASMTVIYIGARNGEPCFEYDFGVRLTEEQEKDLRSTVWLYSKFLRQLEQETIAYQTVTP